MSCKKRAHVEPWFTIRCCSPMQLRPVSFPQHTSNDWWVTKLVNRNMRLSFLLECVKSFFLSYFVKRTYFWLFHTEQPHLLLPVDHLTGLLMPLCLIINYINSTQLSLSCSENMATDPPIGVEVRPQVLSLGSLTSNQPTDILHIFSSCTWTGLDCDSGLRLWMLLH